MDDRPFSDLIVDAEIEKIKATADLRNQMWSDPNPEKTHNFGLGHFVLVSVASIVLLIVLWNMIF